MRLPWLLPKRKPETHKGDYGYCLVLGGSIGLTGAVCLCAQAALRIGAGLVKVGIPRSLNSIIATKLTEIMTLPLSESPEGYLSLESFNEIINVLDDIDVVSLGCGASRNISTKKLILKVISEIDKPFVIDADAINAISTNLDVLEKRKAGKIILTPHLGEFSRLINMDIEQIKKKRKELVKEFALRYNLILVLKGYHTLVSDGRVIYENNTGNPGMATAGSGDVLCGIISGLIAQGLNCFEAAKSGVYIHGLAGDFAAKDKTQSCLIASDIIEYLPKAIKKIEIH